MTNESDIRDLRNKYFELCKDLGEIINEQQGKILSLQKQVKSLKRENWNLRKTKGRRK
jgi:hypothetical protein